MAPKQLLVLTALASCLASPVLGDCLGNKAGFTWSYICPSAADKAALTPVSQRLSGCLMLCASSSSCSAVHQSGASCWLAGASQWDKWQAADAGNPGCRSLLRGPVRPLPSGQFMWFNFRFSSLNLANPGFYTAQMVNATRNVTGAHLGGYGASYVGIAVPEGFQAVAGSGNRFSYFISAERDLKNATYYLRASQDGSQGTVYLFEDNGKIMIGCQPANGKRFDTAAIVSASPARALMSIGIAFNGTSYGVYYDGVLHTPTMNSGFNMVASTASDLRLGASHRSIDDAKSISGRILCFGVWTRQLELADFMYLEEQC